MCQKLNSKNTGHIIFFMYWVQIYVIEFKYILNSIIQIRHSGLQFIIVIFVRPLESRIKPGTFL